MRQVIVHYHLFKNAGTTLDSLLQRKFGDKWVQFDGKKADSKLGPQELRRFIDNHPEVMAVSSHHGRPPFPEISDGVVIPLVFLRHPLDRVGSVYAFEHRQARGSRGAEFAANHTFVEYVRWRLDMGPHGVITNFHALFLLGTLDATRRPIRLSEVPEAIDRLSAFNFFGLVERFADSMTLLQAEMRKTVGPLDTNYKQRNQSVGRRATLAERLDDMRAALGDSLWAELCERNQVDMEIYDRACALFDRRFAKSDHAA